MRIGFKGTEVPAKIINKRRPEAVRRKTKWAHPYRHAHLSSLFFQYENAYFPLLLARLSVAAHKLVYAAGGVDELRLAGVERVGSAGDFEFYHGVSLALKFHGLSGFAAI